MRGTFLALDKKEILSVYRGSYMSAQVLLNLLNELRKSDKLNKFKNTGAQMLDSIIT